MRRAALVLAVMLALVATTGCLHQGDFQVVTIEGTIQGGEAPEDPCALPTPDGSIALEDETVYWAESFGMAPDTLSQRLEGPVPFSLLVYANVAVPADACGPRAELITGDDAADWRYAFGTLGVHVPVEAADGTVTVNGTELAPGDSTTITVNTTATSPRGTEDRYNGTLTVTAHGTWSEGSFQVVESPFVSGADTAYWS